MAILTHTQARAQIQAAADDRSGPADRATLDAHLAQCAECRAYAAALASLEAELPRALEHGLEATPLPAGLPARVLARSRGVPLRQRLVDGFAFALGAGALISLVAVFAWALGSQPPALQPAQGPDEATPTPPVWSTPDFTRQPLHSFPAVAFTGAGSLQGFAVEQPAPESLVVSLLWLPAEAPADLQAFVHLETGPGQVLAQSDAPFPGAPWGAGMYTFTTHSLRLPAGASGAYRLYAGVFSSAAGARLAVEGTAEDRLDLGQLDLPLTPATPTPLPVQLDQPGTPTPCQLGCGEATPTPLPVDALSATPWATFTPCLAGCAEATSVFPPTATPLPTWTPTPAAEATPTSDPGAPPSPTPFMTLTATPCLEGCPELPPTQPPWPTAYTDTPLPPPSATPCEGDCLATPTAFPLTPEPTFTPCQVGCPEASATPLPTHTPAP